MKLFSIAAVFLFGIALKAFACDYDRIRNTADYDEIMEPKNEIGVTRALGLCVNRNNGNFAVISWVGNKFHLFHSCGKLMSAIKLPTGHRNTWDCAFSGNHLYISDQGAKKIYKYSASGKYHGEIATGQPFYHLASCKNHLYAAVNRKDRQNLFVYHKDKEIRRLNIPGYVEGLMIGINGNIYVPKRASNTVLLFTPTGKPAGKISIATKKVRHVTGIAMDSAENLLIFDNHGSSTKVHVYSSCGKLTTIVEKGIRGGAYDIVVGNDGTVIVADYGGNKVFMY